MSVERDCEGSVRGKEDKKSEKDCISIILHYLLFSRESLQHTLLYPQIQQDPAVIMIDELLSGLGGGVFWAHVPCHMDTHTLLHFLSVTAQVRRENERRDEVLLCRVRR